MTINYKENNVKLKLTSLSAGEVVVVRFVNDLIGVIYDLFKFIIKSLCYLVAGMIIAGVPIYMFVWLFSYLLQ
jgi:hypothetical protein